MSMKIDEVLAAIKVYQETLGYDYKYESFEARIEHIRQLHTALNQESAEFLDWLPWKPWRPIEDQEFNKEEAALELIDIFFFTANLWSALGMSIYEFEGLFKQKLFENIRRTKSGYNNVNPQTAKTAKGETE